MDILSHALWAAAGAEVARTVPPPARRVQVRPWWAAFWGAFPDLFAFTIPVGFIVTARLANQDALTPWPPGPQQRTQWAFDLASQLYNLSHSLVVFAAVFGVVWLASRRPRWELLAWLLHILCDIPTHEARFYPTPALWPLSDWRVDGFAWAQPGFLIPDYALLALVWSVLAVRAWRRRAPARAAKGPHDRGAPGGGVERGARIR